MSTGPGKSSRWGEPEQEQVTQAPAEKNRAREAPANQARSRWGNPAPEPVEESQRTPPSATQPARTRWKATTRPLRETEQPPAPSAPGASSSDHPPAPAPINSSGQAKEAQQQATTPDEPVSPLAPPPTPPATLPLPFPMPTETKDPLRQQRSHAWLERLNEPAPPPAPPIRRTRPLPSRSRHIKRLSVIAVPLTIILVLAALLVSVPAVRQRALGLFAGPTATAVPGGTLLAQSNVAGSMLSLNHQTYPLSIQANGEWSVAVSHLNSGTYPLTISAPNYAPASGQVVIQPLQQAVVTAFLTLAQSVYTSLLTPANNLIPGQPLAATIPAGAEYLLDQTAAQALKVSIGYRVISLVDTPDPSILVTDAAVTQPPKPLLSGVVIPVAVFTDATTGAAVDETHPTPLPPANFLLALTVAIDSTGKASFALAAPAVLKATAAGSDITAPGGVPADPALLFILVGLSQSQGISSTGFTCFGLLDSINAPGSHPNPEDGFLFGVNGGAAHYFFRWGQVWTTNAAAQTLTPGLPQANQDTLIQAQTILDAGTLGQPTGCK
jgi:hypothetical protein